MRIFGVYPSEPEAAVLANSSYSSVTLKPLLALKATGAERRIPLNPEEVASAKTPRPKTRLAWRTGENNATEELCVKLRWYTVPPEEA